MKCVFSWDANYNLRGECKMVLSAIEKIKADMIILQLHLRLIESMKEDMELIAIK